MSRSVLFVGSSILVRRYLAIRFAFRFRCSKCGRLYLDYTPKDCENIYFGPRRYSYDIYNTDLYSIMYFSRTDYARNHYNLVGSLLYVLTIFVQ
jgi:hypothetical protein